MEFHEFINLLGRKRKTIFGIMALFILVGVGIIAVQRFKYSSESQLLIVQEHNQTVDAYTAAKSNEYLSSVLADVVASNSFFTKVQEAGFNINTDYFGDTTKDQMKRWTETVSAKSIGDSGIIAVNVYHPDRSQAEKIDRAVNHVLMTQHTAYHGSGEGVKVRLIDQPITSTFPVRPNIVLILSLAAALGFVTALVYVYLLPQSGAIAPHTYGQHARITHPQASQPLTPQRPKMSQPMPNKPHSHEAMPNLPASSWEDEVGGYLEEESEPTPEEISRQGSMKNLLR